MARLVAQGGKIVKKQSAEIKPVTDYWYEFYCLNHCTLCGNSGWLDTRGVRTPAGVETGRVNWCICPNGQAFRKQVGGFGPSGDPNAKG